MGRNHSSPVGDCFVIQDFQLKHPDPIAVFAWLFHHVAAHFIFCYCCLLSSVRQTLAIFYAACRYVQSWRLQKPSCQNCCWIFISTPTCMKSFYRIEELLPWFDIPGRNMKTISQLVLIASEQHSWQFAPRHLSWWHSCRILHYFPSLPNAFAWHEQEYIVTSCYEARTWRSDKSNLSMGAAYSKTRFESDQSIAPAWYSVANVTYSHSTPRSRNGDHTSSNFRRRAATMGNIITSKWKHHIPFEYQTLMCRKEVSPCSWIYTRYQFLKYNDRRGHHLTLIRCKLFPYNAFANPQSAVFLYIRIYSKLHGKRHPVLSLKDGLYNI